MLFVIKSIIGETLPGLTDGASPAVVLRLLSLDHHFLDQDLLQGVATVAGILSQYSIL